MTEIGYYHLSISSLEKVLPKLLEKILDQKARAVVLTTSNARVEALVHTLWTYTPLSFLPHGSAQDGRPQDQPIWLTAVEECPNGANFLVLTDGRDAISLEPYQRCFYIFDGHDPESLEKAHLSWKARQEQGHMLTYWQQTSQGAWEKNKGKSPCL